MLIDSDKLDQVIREYLKESDLSSLDLIKNLYTTLGAYIEFSKLDANDFLEANFGKDSHKDEGLKSQLASGIGLMVHIQTKVTE